MKNIIYPLLTALLFSLFSCQEEVYIEGPPGDPGPEGPAGLDGEEGYTFEWENVDFLSADNYTVFLPLPEDFTMLYSDVVLVYLLWGTEEIDGEVLDIWKPLPQTTFTEFGTMQYGFDFTIYDVSLFLESNFNLNLLGPDYLDDWVVRVVVVPAQFTDGRIKQEVDYSNYYEVVEHFGLSTQPVKVKNIKQRP